MQKEKPDKLRILVVGSGGREHALVRKLKRDGAEVFCAPGNAGIARHAKLVNIKATDLIKLGAFATVEHINLTVVGPEAPLAAGIVDYFRGLNLTIFGPTAAAAKLESSKAWATTFMTKHRIPHPQSVVCRDAASACVILERSVGPVVIKADGLASGKGVFIVRSLKEAQDVIDRLMVKRELGDAGKRVVIQDFLKGREASCMAITDGTSVLALPLARDYKPANPGKDAPMTGGMGAYLPLPDVSPQLEEQILTTIIFPTLSAMCAEENPFTGVLYAGLMLTDDGPKVLEFNVRFGDPETQAVLARLKSSLADILWAAATGTLDELSPPEWSSDDAVCVVAASDGYPGKPKTGYIINGLSAAETEFDSDDMHILHAGTIRTDESGDYLNAGGRALNAVATGGSWKLAREKAYGLLTMFNFPGMWYRRDIAEGL
ncbi:MAG: phosphoribosylamine--glycine ligase [Patescibacteria group bacterium]|nr:phosphoribosylamine--glycine ligase [Patescibacteria group bacterium]